jgi:hypothetical protein
LKQSLKNKVTTLFSRWLWCLLALGAFYHPLAVTDAQTLGVLHNFTGSDGWDVLGGPTLSSNVLYGTTKSDTGLGRQFHQPVLPGCTSINTARRGAIWVVLALAEPRK